MSSLLADIHAHYTLRLKDRYIFPSTFDDLRCID